MPLTDKTFSQCQPCWGFKPANQIFPKLHMDVLRRSGMKEDGVKDKWERPRRKEEEEGGRSQLLRSDRIQLCFHCVKSSELSSEAWAWPAGRCGKRRSPWEIAVRRVLSCYGTVRCCQVPIGWHKTLSKGDCFFKSLPVSYPLSAGEFKRWLPRIEAGNYLDWIREFYESSFLLFKNALCVEPVWDLLRNQQSHQLYLLHFSTGAANRPMWCHRGHSHPLQVSDNSCSQMFTPPPETTLFFTFSQQVEGPTKKPGSCNAIFLLQALNRALNMLSSGVSDDKNKDLQIGKMGPLMQSLSC